MFHFIFHYNYGNFFIVFDYFSTIGNRNEYSTKRVQTVLLQRALGQLPPLPLVMPMLLLATLQR